MTWLRWVGSVVLALMAAFDPWWQGKPLPISWAIAVFCGIFMVSYFGIRELKQRLARVSMIAAFSTVTFTHHLINSLWLQGQDWTTALERAWPRAASTAAMTVFLLVLAKGLGSFFGDPQSQQPESRQN